MKTTGCASTGKKLEGSKVFQQQGIKLNVVSITTTTDDRNSCDKWDSLTSGEVR